MSPMLDQTPSRTPDIPTTAQGQRSTSGNVRGPKPASTSSNNNASETVTKRLQSELMTLMLSKDRTISAFPTTPSNLLHWTGTLHGPPDTPYSGLTLKLTFQFPTNYPFAPPEVLFTTPIYHPNIDFSGRICLDILKDKWSAVLNVQSVLVSLQSLLGEPNCGSPLNGEAAELWEGGVEGRRVFGEKVRGRHREPGELGA